MELSVEDRLKHFGSIDTTSINITRKAYFMFRIFLLLPFKFSRGNSDLELYTCRGVSYMLGGLS